MRHRFSTTLLGMGLCLASVVAGRPAGATNAFEVPDTGVEQFGRGGAWVARASDPLAAFMNPATLATQESGVALNLNLIWQKTCLSPRDAAGNPTTAAFSGTGYRGTYPSETCNTNSGTPFPNPALSAVWRASDKLGIGLSVQGPNSVGKLTYPDSVTSAEGKTMPAPTRYMLLEQEGLVVLPTLSAGYSVMPNLQVGAGFVWGIASFSFANISQALGSSVNSDDWSSDIKATLEVKDLFVPGAVAGVLYSPTSTLDVAAWYMISDSIKAKGDAYIEGTYYNDPGSVKDPSRYNCGDGKQSPCTQTTGDAASVTIRQPMQAKIGMRYHQPRGTAGTPGVRDPIADDVFDAEIDFTWSHNSVVENLEIRFPDSPPVNIDWLAGGVAPPNSDVPHHFKDVVDVRVGGDYVAIPKRLSLRAGGFFETAGQNERYLNIDFVPAQRFGLAAGATVRVGSFDIMVSGGHIFPGKLDNGGNGALRGLAGSQATSPVVNRTQFIIDDGSVSQSTTIVGVGSTYRF